MNTTINSQAMQLLNAVGYAIQIEFTGTPTGSFKLEASNDPVPKASQTFGVNGVVTYAPSDWTDISNSTIAVSAAGNIMYNYQAIPGYNYVRVVYTDTSGGTSTAIITGCTFNSKGV
jgi:hypothetical protein